MTTVGTTPRALAPIDEVRWIRRPVLAWSVRLGLVTGPFVVSLALAWLLTALSPEPSGVLVAVGRWIAIAATSSMTLVGLDRFARRLLPIAALLDLTLAFPDRAPSRFKVALRTGSTAQLEQRMAEVRSEAVADPSISASQRVIELVAALRVHDRITRGHSERVRAYTQMIADEMGLPEAQRERLRWAGLLHDVGKLLVPTSILNKDGRLTDEEFEIIKSHPENGRRIVEDLVPWLGESARAVWEHHEKWDGSGYPRGLAGEDISLAARIVAVADVYDVMTSTRSYKDPVSPKEARAELARCAGSHFDPVVVRAFLNLSLGRVRRSAGPISWLAQLTLLPSAVAGSTQAAGGVVVLTGALSASAAGAGAGFPADTWSVLDPREVASWTSAGDGSAVAATKGDVMADDVEAFIIVTVPRTVISVSTASAAPADIVVTPPPTTVSVASPVVTPPPTLVVVAAPAAPNLTSGTITTIPPATDATVATDGSSAVADPPTTRPITISTPPTTSVPLTVTVATTTRPITISTPPTTIVPPTVTIPTTTAPMATLSQVATSTTMPSASVPPPVTLPNGKPRPVRANPVPPPASGRNSTRAAAAIEGEALEVGSRRGHTGTPPGGRGASSRRP